MTKVYGEVKVLRSDLLPSVVYVKSGGRKDNEKDHRTVKETPPPLSVRVRRRTTNLVKGNGWVEKGLGEG